MGNKNRQDNIFLKYEGDKYFDRNRINFNKAIFDSVKYLKPNKSHNILEVGCGSGTTLSRINKIFKSKVFGLDTSKKAINFAKSKYNLKNLFNNTFLSFRTIKKFDIVISGWFLYVTPDEIINSTIKKLIRLVKKNSFLVICDYDTPKSYLNDWKYNKNIKSYKRDLLKLVYKNDKKLYLVSKKLFIHNGIEIKKYDKKLKLDNIFTVLIFKKI